MDIQPRGAYLYILLTVLYAQGGCTKEKSALITLDDSNWDKILTGHWMVEFYAPWCPACQSLQSQWEAFAVMSKDLNLNVGQVDVTKSPGLSGRFMVTALPTIFHVLDGEFRQYRSSRTKEDFISFIKEEKWASIEPVPGWKSPDSFQMAMVSYLFKLSMVLRSLHTQLMEDYGLPTWGSYLIFAVATIIMGALLGIVLVALIDHFYPPKPHSVVKPVVNAELKKRKKKTEQESGGGDADSVDEDSDKLNVDDDDEEEDEEEEDNDDLKDDLVSDKAKSVPQETSSVQERPKNKDLEKINALRSSPKIKRGSEESSKVTEVSQSVQDNTNGKEASEEPNSAGLSPKVIRRRTRKAD